MSFVVFGYASHDGWSKTRQRMIDFAARLGEVSDLDVGVTPVATYERLAQLLRGGDLDFAWLSPISLASLAHNRVVRPVVSLRRDDSVHYRCALIVRTESDLDSFEDLNGKRAAWVDPHSASGFVLPRIELAKHAVRLGGERLYGSHEAVVRAVASGQADFGATFVHAHGDGATRGAWSDAAGLATSIRVMTIFGEIPPDAIAVRCGVEPKFHDEIARALRAMTREAADRELLADVFGARGFETPLRSTYEPLRNDVFGAYRDGVLDIDVPASVIPSDGAATLEHRAIPAEIVEVTSPPLRAAP